MVFKKGYMFPAKMIILDYEKLGQIICVVRKWLDMSTCITKLKDKDSLAELIPGLALALQHFHV